MTLPEYEPKERESRFPLLPVGRHIFQITEEPEIRQTKKGTDYPRFTMKATFIDGVTRPHVQSFFPWDSLYCDLLFALGAEQKDDGRPDRNSIGELIGKRFEGDVVHTKHHKYSDLTIAKIVSIVVERQKQPHNPLNEGGQFGGAPEDDDLPF